MSQQNDNGGSLVRGWGYLSQAWLVIGLALIYGGALAGVQSTLGPIIADNKKKETYEKIPELVEGASQEQTREVPVTDATGKSRTVYEAVGDDGTRRGWVLPTSGQGFADRIDLLIGVDSTASTITGLYVLDQKETPNLGSHITNEEMFLSQFPGKSAEEPLGVSKSPPAPESNDILAITGATISSESVADIVNKTLADLKEPIRRISATSELTQPDG